MGKTIIAMPVPEITLHQSRAVSGGGLESPVDQSLITSVAARTRGYLTDRFGEWFGPNRPLPAVAPEGTRARQMDYGTGYNIQTTPRGEEAISFDQLRSLADNYDLLRLCIETRKDQVSKMPHQYKLKAKEGEKKGDLKKRQGTDERVLFLEQFFKRPDRENLWRDWARMLLDDLLVIDAPCILPRFTLGSGLYGFDLVDGATIKRVLNVEGKTPVPPETAYQQILKGVPAVNLTSAFPQEPLMPQLIYAPRNKRTNKVYGYSPVEQIIMTVNIALRRQIHQLEYYTAGNVPDVIIGTPKTWTPDAINRYEAQWNNILGNGNTGARRRAKFVPGGPDFSLNFTKEQTLKDEFDEWLARLVAFAFSIPPNALVKMVNRASGEQMAESSLEEGLEPILLWFADLMNSIIEMYFGYDDIEFAWGTDVEVDPKTAAEIRDLDVRNGSISIDEAREDMGRDPIGMPNAIFTGAGAVLIDDVKTLSTQMTQAPEPDPNAPNADPNADPNAKKSKKKESRSAPEKLLALWRSGYPV